MRHATGAHQNATKLRDLHCLRSGSTGFRSWFASMSWAAVRPGSLETASLSARRPNFDSLTFSMTLAILKVVLAPSNGSRRGVDSPDEILSRTFPPRSAEEAPIPWLPTRDNRKLPAGRDGVPPFEVLMDGTSHARFQQLQRRFFTPHA